MNAGFTPFPPFPTLMKVGLGLGLGLIIGLERERRHKEAGIRTFSLVGLMGTLAGLLGGYYPLLSLALTGILVFILNWETIRSGEGAELTTSAALLLTGFIGVLCGLGHAFTPVAVAVVTAACLASKQRLAGFSINLTEPELRSAILLALLAFVIYPILPVTPPDPWGLIDPREVWLTVILIASIGFANYILLKIYGDRGVEIAGFLGGLVNSSAVVAELSARVADTDGQLADVVYRAVLLATAGMAARNAALLGILSLGALSISSVALALILGASMILALRAVTRRLPSTPNNVKLHLRSPFSVQSALQFGLIFMALQVVGTLTERNFGHGGFYGVSIIGGLFSSASAVASAGALGANGTISPAVAGIGATLASVASAAINLPLAARFSRNLEFTKRLTWALGVIVLVGIVGAFMGTIVVRLIDGMH